MEPLVSERATAMDSQHQSSSSPLPAPLTGLPPLNALIKVNVPLHNYDHSVIYCIAGKLW